MLIDALINSGFINVVDFGEIMFVSGPPRGEGWGDGGQFGIELYLYDSNGDGFEETYTALELNQIIDCQTMVLDRLQQAIDYFDDVGQDIIALAEAYSYQRNLEAAFESYQGLSRGGVVLTFLEGGAVPLFGLVLGWSVLVAEVAEYLLEQDINSGLSPDLRDALQVILNYDEVFAHLEDDFQNCAEVHDHTGGTISKTNTNFEELNINDSVVYDMKFSSIFSQGEIAAVPLVDDFV